jgi:hypothetical protein
MFDTIGAAGDRRQLDERLTQVPADRTYSR